MSEAAGEAGAAIGVEGDVFVGAENGEEVDDVRHEARRLLGIEVLVSGGQLAPDRQASGICEAVDIPQ